MAADFLEYEERLRAIPVVHHRIAFAQMVLRALRDPSWRPDVVAIELPPSIGAPAWGNLEEVNAGPLWIGKVIESTCDRDASRHSRGADWELVVRDEHELDAEPSPEVVDPVIEVYPLHSGDAYLAAMRYARAHHIDVAFVDRELTDIGEWTGLRRRSEERARRRGGLFIEDAMVQEEGLESFYGRQRVVFDAARAPQIDLPRERHMAACLKRFLRQGRRVFFLCGAAHWTAIRELLDDPSFEPQTEEELCVPGVVLCGGPYAVAGAASELPRAVYEFETLRRSGREAEFRHLRTAHELERRIERRLLKNPAYAPSQIGVFKRYLDRLCRQTGVILPRHFHWTEAARSCLGPAGSRVVMQESMKFWRNCPGGVATLRRASLAPSGVTGDFGTAGSFTLTSRWGSPDVLYNVTEGVADDRVPFYGGAGEGGRIFSQDGWEQLMSRMMILAKRYASPRLRAPSASPLGGVLRGAVDGRATARARARGDRRIYEKAVTPQPLNSLSEWEGFDPVVWLFQPDVSSSLETMFLDKPGDCHAVVAGAQHSGLAGSREWRFGLFASWVPRFADADPEMLGRLERWLAQGNEAFVPTQRDLDRAGADRGWRRCSLAERVLCVALDRCRTHVVLVSPVQASARVREDFRQRRKRLLHVEMARFDARDVAGLRSPVLMPRNASPG